MGRHEKGRTIAKPSRAELTNPERSRDCCGGSPLVMTMLGLRNYPEEKERPNQELLRLVAITEHDTVYV